MDFLRKAAFFVLIVFCLSPLGSPAAALILGIGLALTIGTPFPQLRGRPTKLLFLASVALLGFGTDLTTVYHSLQIGALPLIVGFVVLIVMAFPAIWFLKLYHPLDKLLLEDDFADETGKASSLSSIFFVLGVLSLMLYPVIANILGMTADQLGVWSAVIVPGHASAIGTAQSLGQAAVNVVVPLLMVRVLGRILIMAIASRFDDGPGPNWNDLYLVFVFCLVALFRTYAPVSIFPSIFDSFVNLGNAGIVLTLFLWGTSLSLGALRDIGMKIGVVALLVWASMSAIGLWAVMHWL